MKSKKEKSWFLEMELVCKNPRFDVYLYFCCCFDLIAEGLPARFYVGHSVYKGKAALTVDPRAPEFVSLDVSLYPPKIKELKLYNYGFEFSI